MMKLNDQQRNFLLSNLGTYRVSQRAIGGGKQASYLEAYDVRRHLIRVFGYGNFDIRTLHTECVVDRPVTWTTNNNQEKSGFDVAYLVTVELLVRGEEGMAVYSASAVGAAEHQPSLAQAHDHAVKSAESDALKRAAINLGTQFGLSLYQNGSPLDIVNATLDVGPAPDTSNEQPVVPESDTEAVTERVDTATGEITEAEAPQDVPHVGQSTDEVVERIRAIYSLDTAAAKIQAVATLKEELGPDLLATKIVDKQGNDITIERALDTAASAALAQPMAGNAAAATA